MTQPESERNGYKNGERKDRFFENLKNWKIWILWFGMLLFGMVINYPFDKRISNLFVEAGMKRPIFMSDIFYYSIMGMIYLVITVIFMSKKNSLRRIVFLLIQYFVITALLYIVFKEIPFQNYVKALSN